jgi:hypothetical protein
MWHKFPQQLSFFKTLTIIYWLCPSGYKLEIVWCTHKCAEVWYPNILGSTGLRYRSVAQITRGLIHLGFIHHAKPITSIRFQLCFQLVEILSSLWMSLEGKSPHRRFLFILEVPRFVKFHQGKKHCSSLSFLTLYLRPNMPIWVFYVESFHGYGGWRRHQFFSFYWHCLPRQGYCV